MNSSSPRLKRVPPERERPIRNPLVAEIPRTAAAHGPISGEALRGALECGVQTAYAVIDEYMQRGYEAARLNPRNGREHMSNGRSPNDKSPYNNPFSPWGPMTPLMDQWTAAMKTWTDAWSAFLPGAKPGAWPSAAWPTAAAPSSTSTATAAPLPVSVEVSSQRPTEVTVHLKQCVEQVVLSADSFIPPLLNSVSLDHKGGSLHVRVTIANDQPAGRYNGVIRTADGSIAGDLTVAISASPKT